jgi:hypothetical protein
MTSTAEAFTIDPRYCGPPRSGNGGYVCGRLAHGLGGTVRVRLKAPPPIGTRLRIVEQEEGAQLLDGEVVIAEAGRTTLELEVPACPSLVEAERASARYLGFVEHNFPTCFVCGPHRRPGDGLRLFPGALDADASILAAPWTPDASLADETGHVRTEFLWAALDCPGAFTRYPLAPGVALVLGELCVRCVGSDPLVADTPCIVIAWPLGDEGRRRHAGTAIFRADGRLVAVARAIWVEVPAQVWA